jgi:hypothetical protein
MEENFELENDYIKQPGAGTMREHAAVHARDTAMRTTRSSAVLACR